MRALGPDHPFNKEYDYPDVSDQSEEAKAARAEYKKAARAAGLSIKPTGAVKIMWRWEASLPNIEMIREMICF